MSADLHLYVIEGTDDEIREFLDAHEQFFMHSDNFFSTSGVPEEELQRLYASYDAAAERYSDLFMERTKNFEGNNIWIGEVSWLKADLYGNKEKYIPAAVAGIAQLFQDVPVVDADLIARAHREMSRENITTYKVADPDDIAAWLGEVVGLRVAHESL